MTEEQTTTAVTVEINTATMAAEQQEQVEELADTLTGELENKTVKWLDFGWTDEMIEMRDEVSRLTKENPVRDVYDGMPTDVSVLISDAFNSPIQGGDWFEQRDSINELVDLSVQEVNDFIVSASN